MTDDNATLKIKTSEIVSAYVVGNKISTDDLPALMRRVHSALAGLGREAPTSVETTDKPTPAQIRKSIKPDGLVSFIDGKTYQTLKRHLTLNGLDLSKYIERFGLPKDYPSTAANYSKKRSELAKSVGLGFKRAKAPPKEAEAPPQKKPMGRPRKPKL